MTSVEIRIEQQSDNDEEEYIIIEHTQMIDFCNMVNRKANKDTIEANLCVKGLSFNKGKDTTMKKLLARAGFTAGVMVEHFGLGQLKVGMEYYSKYIDCLRDCDEFLSENYKDGKYLYIINHLHSDKKKYENLKDLNIQRYFTEKALKHLFEMELNGGEDVVKMTLD